MHAIDRSHKELDAKGADFAQRLELMILKARVWAESGNNLKGFSTIMHAVNFAYQARLLPLLWDSVGALCHILNDIGEFGAASKLLVNILPMVLECNDCERVGRIFATVADAQMGLAGEARALYTKSEHYLSKALEYLGGAFDSFSQLEFREGQCETLAKRATIMLMMGDHQLANDHASKYLDVRRQLTIKTPA